MNTMNLWMRMGLPLQETTIQSMNPVEINEFENEIM